MFSTGVQRVLQNQALSLSQAASCSKDPGFSAKRVARVIAARKKNPPCFAQHSDAVLMRGTVICALELRSCVDWRGAPHRNLISFGVHQPSWTAAARIVASSSTCICRVSSLSLSLFLSCSLEFWRSSLASTSMRRKVNRHRTEWWAPHNLDWSKRWGQRVVVLTTTR